MQKYKNFKRFRPDPSKAKPCKNCFYDNGTVCIQHAYLHDYTESGELKHICTYGLKYEDRERLISENGGCSGYRYGGFLTEQ